MPWVTHSPLVPNKGLMPLSTLMPGMMPLDFISSTSGVPSSAFWYSVSSNKMTPEMYCSRPARQRIRHEEKRFDTQKVRYNNPTFGLEQKLSVLAAVLLLGKTTRGPSTFRRAGSLGTETHTYIVLHGNAAEALADRARGLVGSQDACTGIQVHTARKGQVAHGVNATCNHTKSGGIHLCRGQRWRARSR
jgi:hypothetical protein